MNSLYNSNYSIFFADEKIIINRFLTFNENITQTGYKINFIKLLNDFKDYNENRGFDR